MFEKSEVMENTGKQIQNNETDSVMFDSKASVAFAGGEDEATVNKLKFVDTSQEYLESRHQFDNSKVMDNTGHQIRIYEDTKPVSVMFNGSVLLGWCTDYRGTNADSDVSTSGAQIDQNVMGYENPHHLDSHHGHLGADPGNSQRNGDWVRQKADHAHPRVDPLWDTGGQQEIPERYDHLAEPPGRAHVQGGVVKERAYHDDLTWDTGGRRVRQDSHSHHQEGQHSCANSRQEAVEECVCTD